MRWSKRDLTAKRYVYFWVDGIHVQARLEDAAPCLLVIVGATGLADILWIPRPRLRSGIPPARPLHPAHQHENKNDDEHKSEATRRVVTPLTAIGPSSLCVQPNAGAIGCGFAKLANPSVLVLSVARLARIIGLLRDSPAIAPTC
jgi:hypothetical protein